MLSSRVPLRQLALLCRTLSTSLNGGVPIIKAFDLAAGKALDPRIRNVIRDVTMQLKSGDDVAEALRSHGQVFPELMIDMVGVAEQTGGLPEVLASLADHYENNLRLRKDFYGQIAIPVVQFTAAIFIVAGLIFLLGMIAASTGSEAFDPLGFGLTGASGAAYWLMLWAILLASLFIGYKVLASSLQGQRMVHQFLLGIPVIGGCMRSFAIARFSWAFHLTQEAGMPIDKSIDYSFRATANGAFNARAPQVLDELMAGEHLSDALAHTHLFPDEFIEIVHVGETSGTVPETLHRLSPQFEEQARRSLRALAAAAGWFVWCCVAAFIIFLVFRIALWYIGLLNQAVNDAMAV